jgi:hypothetical protein
MLRDGYRADDFVPGPLVSSIRDGGCRISI